MKRSLNHIRTEKVLHLARIRRHVHVSVLLMILVVLVSMPRGTAAGTSLPPTVYLYTQPPFGCAVATYSVVLPAGSLLNIDMISDQTVYLYLMTPESFSSWSYRHQCNSPGWNVLLYQTIPSQLGHTLHWGPPSNGTYYFVFEYDAQIPPVVIVHLIDHSSIPSQG